MENFIFTAPTELVFGNNAEDQIPNLIKKYNGKNVLIHSGGSSAEKSGLLPKIKKMLEDAEINYTEFAGVVPNPRLSHVLAGIAIAKQKKCDFILAVGGGSVIDSAKAIAVGYYSQDVWNDFYVKGLPVEKSLPIGAVLTIPAAGSEVSGSSVITNEVTGEKRSLVNPAKKYCDFSIVNPIYSKTVSNFNMASGIVDMLGHIFERYFSLTENTELINSISEAAMRTIIEQGQILMADRNNINPLKEIVLASSLAHNNIFGIGKIQDWASHGIEHELSAKWDISHGSGLAVIYPAWLKFIKKHGDETHQNVLNRFFKKVITLNKLEEFYKNIGMPIKLSELNICPTDWEIEDMTKRALNKRDTLGQFYKLNKNDIIEIYNIAK